MRPDCLNRSETCCPAPGLIPYEVNAPLWSDGAAKERYVAIPGNSKIEFDAIFFPDVATGRGPHGWKFPDGTVLVKTFFLDLENGNQGRRIRLETRILQHKHLVGTEEVGDQFWRGYTYVWNDDQTDATLLDNPNGLDRIYTIIDRDAPGGQRRQTWHFPSRTECMVCHTMPAKFVLGVNTLQMNRDFDYGGVVDNQLRAWEHIGLFTKPLPAKPENLPSLVDYADERAGHRPPRPLLSPRELLELPSGVRWGQRRVSTRCHARPGRNWHHW